MDFQIKDGTGKGYRAKVDADNRVHTFSTSHTLSYTASTVGRAFMAKLNDGLVSVTTSTDWIFYLKNNDPDRVLIMERLIGTPTGAMIFQTVQNPDVTTIGNNNTSIDVLTNLNFASAVEPIADIAVWDGASGNGLTGLSGGQILAPLFVPGAGVVNLEFGEDWIIPNGSSLAIKGTAVGGTFQLALLFTFFWHKPE